AGVADRLADEAGLPPVRGPAGDPAHHGRASHDIRGAFKAWVRAGQGAERLAAPAEAHRHFDQALALWERVTDPEKLASMQRGWLGFESATNAAASGDLHRAVQRLRRLLTYVTKAEDPVLVSRANERLAYYLLAIDAHAAAL